MPVRPATTKELYQPLVATEATALGLPVPLIYQLIDQESKWNPKAVSPKGARGLMQLMPETAKGLGVDPDDPVQNIRGGLKYLRQLVDQYQGDTTKALAAYNAGPGAVDRYQGVPPFAETRTYVQAVGQGQPTTLPTTPKGRIRPAAPEEMPATPPPTPTTMIGAGPSGALRFSRVATPLVGAIAGAMKGGAMGAPGGPLTAAGGAILGAGLGAGGGELLQSGWEYLTSDAPPTPSGIASRVGSATTTGVVGEATGRGITAVAGRLARPLLRPFADDVEPYAQEAMSTFRRPGGPPAVLPSEVSRSRTLDVAENIAEGSILGGKRITGIKEARQQIAEEKVLQTLDDLGPRVGTKQAGQSVVRSRDEAIQRFRGSERQAWGDFEKAVGDVPMRETPRLDDFIAEATNQQKGTIIPNAGMTAAQRVAALTGEADDAATLMIGGRDVNMAMLSPQQQMAYASAGVQPPPPPTLTIAQFQKTVSNLGTLVNRLTKAARMDPTKNADLGLAKRLYGLAQQDLDDAIAGVSDEAVQAYAAARTTSRLGNRQFFNEEVRAVVRGAPEKVVGRLLKRDNSTAITAVQRAVGPGEFAEVQSAALQRILRPNARSGSVNWGQVSTRLDSLGDDTIKALFPGGHADEVRRVAKLMQELNRKPAGGIGRLGIQFTQWGAVAGLATGTFAPAAGTVLLGPAMMSRVFTNPTALKWLSTGLSAPKGSQAAVTAATQLAAFLGRDVEESEPPPQPSRAVGAGPLATSGPPRPSTTR